MESIIGTSHNKKTVDLVESRPHNNIALSSYSCMPSVLGTLTLII